MNLRVRPRRRGQSCIESQRYVNRFYRMPVVPVCTSRVRRHCTGKRQNLAQWHYKIPHVNHVIPMLESLDVACKRTTPVRVQSNIDITGFHSDASYNGPMAFSLPCANRAVSSCLHLNRGRRRIRQRAQTLAVRLRQGRIESSHRLNVMQAS